MTPQVHLLEVLVEQPDREVAVVLVDRGGPQRRLACPVDRVALLRRRIIAEQGANMRG